MYYRNVFARCQFPVIALAYGKNSKQKDKLCAIIKESFIIMGLNIH